MILPLLLLPTSRVGTVGPVPTADAEHANVGWIIDHAQSDAPTVTDGALTVTGDVRAYLVQDFQAGGDWGDHRYVRSDMHEAPLSFTLDLSGVDCGCLACVYLVAMKDPTSGNSQYCDMAENVAPGWEGGMCTEVDILEANNHAMQTAIHTQTGGTYGSGNCDRNGCFARVGGPQSPSEMQNKYGKGKYIDSTRPFGVETRVDADGAMTIELQQGEKTVTSFDRHMAGNPQGHGVPSSALSALKAAQGKLALVISMWASPDMSWLDGGCSGCNLNRAHFTISNVHVRGSPSPGSPPLTPPPLWPPPPMLPPPPTPSPPPPAPKAPPPRPPPSPRPMPPPKPPPPPPSPPPDPPPPSPSTPLIFGYEVEQAERAAVGGGVVAVGLMMFCVSLVSASTRARLRADARGPDQAEEGEEEDEEADEEADEEGATRKASKPRRRNNSKGGEAFKLADLEKIALKQEAVEEVFEL